MLRWPIFLISLHTCYGQLQPVDKSISKRNLPNCVVIAALRRPYKIWIFARLNRAIKHYLKKLQEANYICILYTLHKRHKICTVLSAQCSVLTIHYMKRFIVNFMMSSLLYEYKCFLLYIT